MPTCYLQKPEQPSGTSLYLMAYKTYSLLQKNISNLPFGPLRTAPGTPAE